MRNNNNGGMKSRRVYIDNKPVHFAGRVDNSTVTEFTEYKIAVPPLARMKNIRWSLRERAKASPIYHNKITSAVDGYIEIDGEMGIKVKVIPINNIGKYLFGVPGFKSHIAYETPDENDVVIVKVPTEIIKKCPDVDYLFKTITESPITEEQIKEMIERNAI